jgi:hypothetical protein
LLNFHQLFLEPMKVYVFLVVYDQVHEVFKTVTKHISLCVKVFYRFFHLVCINLQFSETLKINNMRFMILMMVLDFL